MDTHSDHDGRLAALGRPAEPPPPAIVGDRAPTWRDSAATSARIGVSSAVVRIGGAISGIFMRPLEFVVHYPSPAAASAAKACFDVFVRWSLDDGAAVNAVVASTLNSARLGADDRLREVDWPAGCAVALASADQVRIPAPTRHGRSIWRAIIATTSPERVEERPLQPPTARRYLGLVVAAAVIGLVGAAVAVWVWR